MTLFEGDRYSEISVFSNDDQINAIEVKTDQGQSLSLGLSSGDAEESFVLFQKDSRDPLQFFGFEGFSTDGKLNGFRTIAFTRSEYDEQSVKNE